MNKQSLNIAVSECKRFMARVKELECQIGLEAEELKSFAIVNHNTIKTDAEYKESAKRNILYSSKYSGAVKRASMDLTRALADLRRV